jgi:hypothetical protein
MSSSNDSQYLDSSGSRKMYKKHLLKPVWKAMNQKVAG